MADNQFDVIVVGAGPGGYVAAIKAAQEGLKTLIVEKEYYGGVCLNIGCIPTKALLKGTKVYDLIQHANQFGIDIKDLKAIAPNWVKMQERKAAVVKKLTSGVEYLLTKNKVTKVKGVAVPVDKNTIKVGDVEYKCKNLIIATGSVARHLPLPGFDEARKAGFVVDSTGALSLPKIPESMVVIGGGVIGIEFAALYRRLGTKVTILQGLSTILEMLDKDVSTEMTKLLRQNKVTIETDVKIKEIKKVNDKFAIVYADKDGKEQNLVVDYCLESVGRAPITAGFEKIVKTGPRGNIEVDDYCQTNIPNVYAIGDVTGRAMLAHVASAQALVAVDHIIGKPDKMNYDLIPSCIYSHPEVASVGLTEEQVKERKIPYKAFTFPLSANGKAIADGDTDGFVKIIAGTQYGEILGAHIVCATATDMISELTTLMVCEGTIYELGKAIHPHPTLSEIVMEVAHGLQDKAINI